MNPSTRRRKRLVAAGLVATALSVAGTGAAMAANGAKDAPEAAAEPATGVEEAPTEEAWITEMPEGFSPAQLEALEAAGYTVEDLDALGTLWGTEYTDTKVRAGQMLLDGVELPVAPGSTPSAFPGEDDAATFWDAGYTFEDAEALAALWGVEIWDAKVRAGQAITAGEAVPIAPGASVTP